MAAFMYVHILINAVFETQILLKILEHYKNSPQVLKSKSVSCGFGRAAVESHTVLCEQMTVTPAVIWPWHILQQTIYVTFTC